LQELLVQQSNFLYEKFEDTKVATETANRRTDNTTTKRTNNDLQQQTQHLQTKDRAARIPIKTGVNSDTSEWSAVPVPLVTPIVCSKI